VDDGRALSELMDGAPALVALLRFGDGPCQVLCRRSLLHGRLVECFKMLECLSRALGADVRYVCTAAFQTGLGQMP
jgi:hypothetical protein